MKDTNKRKRKKRPRASKPTPNDSSCDHSKPIVTGGDEEERNDTKAKIIHSLTEAFDSISLEEATSAYCAANGDVNKAAEILTAFTESNGEDPSTSSSVSGGSSSLDSGSTSGSSLGFVETSCVQNLADYGNKKGGSRQKRVVAVAGTVANMLGKDYVRASPRKAGRFKEVGNDQSGFDREEVEQFLYSMLGDECQLSISVVRDVLCQCGYNFEKALEVLLDLSASSNEQCRNDDDDFSFKEERRFISDCSYNFTDRASDCTSHSSEGDLYDSIWSAGYNCRNYLKVLTGSEVPSPINASDQSDLPQKVLESLFNMSKSPEHKPTAMNWRNVVKKLQTLGPQFDVSPSNDMEPQQDLCAKGEEYQAFRKDAKQQWNSMKSCYQKASAAYSKGEWEYAAYLSEQGKSLTKLAQKADEKASHDIFKARNKNFENVITIDLHGQHVKPAMKLLKLHLVLGSYVQSVQTLRVITGCGSHGVGKSKLKQSVIKLVEKEGLPWSEENRGAVLIKLDGFREFSFLDTDSDSELPLCFTRKCETAEAGRPPADVKELFNKYAQGSTHMTAEQLWQFLAEVQGQGGTSMADAERIVEEVLQRWHHIDMFTRCTLTLEDFHHYLFSTDLNPPLGNQVYQDMTAPLSHYFIYTGHNSYLTGNQFSSDCSDVPIIKALKRGVRVIELDLWPNSARDDVLVLHGRTLTTPVEVIKCLRAIKEHAFSASPYPVILTLEDHLNPDLQAKVAQMITETFGEMLYCPESEVLKEFPSPEELKYRIIISTKPPKERRETKSINSRKDNSPMQKDSTEDVAAKEPSDLTANQADDEKSDYDSSEHNQYDDDNNEAYDHLTNPPGLLAYKRLIAIPNGKLRSQLKEELNLELEKVRRISLSEQKFKTATVSYGTDFIRFTQKNILRIFPKQTRVNSSNYKPMIGWMHGAQMVAFNMQGYGKSLWLMQGMFRANAGCGYVKKPNFLLKKGPDCQDFDLKEKLPAKKTLKVKVYMGEGWHLDFKQMDCKFWSPPQFFARVGVAGVAADKKMKRTKKKVDSWTPVWDEEEFTFPLTVPELALLRVEVRKYNNMPEKGDFAGQTCLPVFQLWPGIRAVPLFDRKGEELRSVRLLIRFEL